MKTERIEDGRRREARRPSAWLVRVGNARDPIARPVVYPLEDRNRIVLGRRDAEQAPRAEQISVEDRAMSSAHAALELTDEGAELTDLGSSNGTLVWGQHRSRGGLDDGDLFETGNTIWIFRRRIAPDHWPPEAETPPSLHPDLHTAYVRLQRLAHTQVPVMILGETGTGKEVLARALHTASGREGPFVAINTGAVQSNLVASELFGVEQGAHSTAERSRRGQIRAADGGTLLLDEIGDMPLEVQVSLLRVIQESEVLPVGGDQAVKVDVRFLCATHQDLDAMVREGRFRSDLYARLKGATLQLPPLRDRLEDLGALVGTFLHRYHAADLAFSPAAYRALFLYDWPLNVRGLEKAIEAAVAICDTVRIEVDHLPAEITRHRSEDKASVKKTDGDGEDRRREILRLLEAHQGNVSAVARSMGYSRMQVHRWLKQLSIDPSSFR